MKQKSSFRYITNGVTNYYFGLVLSKLYIILEYDDKVKFLVVEKVTSSFFFMSRWTFY